MQCIIQKYEEIKAIDSMLLPNSETWGLFAQAFSPHTVSLIKLYIFLISNIHRNTLLQIYIQIIL